MPDPQWQGLRPTGKTPRRCQSRSQYGDCWLYTNHDGDHMIPIIVDWDTNPDDPNDLWFGYTRRTRTPLGYILTERGALP